jgi:choline dehydrogenase
MKRWDVRRRQFLKLLGIGTATAATSCDDTGSATSDVTASDYEYIIVGSGAGGGPLACNLARAGHRVLLLEAGDDQGHLVNQQVPALHVKSTEEPTMRWDFFVKHYDDPSQQERDTKFVADPGPHHEPGVLYPRAGTLGGCTAHHAMITVYPHAKDWNHIADVTGDESWRAENMRCYFTVLERCLYIDRNDEDPTKRSGHGFDGWLSTTMPNAKAALTDLKLVKVVTAAAKAFGLTNFLDGPLKSIFNGDAFALKHLVDVMQGDLNTNAPDRDSKEGLFGVPQATDGQKRKGPREYILDTIDSGYPLTLQTNALATRIIFEQAEGGPRATGVEILVGKHLYRADPLVDQGDEGETKQVFATREVILSCGAFNTPQLLKLSGIGPQAELDGFGIEARNKDGVGLGVIDRPGVGTNLQDRYEVGVVSELSRDFSALEDCTFGVEPDPCLDDWREGKGLYVNHGAAVSVVMKSRDDLDTPDLIIFGLPGYFKGYEPGYSNDVFGAKDKFTWAVLKGHTGNTAGTVTLRSDDPRDVPDIRFRYFHEGSTDQGQDADDLHAMVQGVSFARLIGREADNLLLFSKYEEVVPGSEVTDVETFVKDEAWGHHASCTCPIGADDDPNAVLDSRLRVRGVQGLRVVDASVFPKIPGFFIVVPIYMVSEKACDMILDDLGELRTVCAV